MKNIISKKITLSFFSIIVSMGIFIPLCNNVNAEDPNIKGLKNAGSNLDSTATEVGYNIQKKEIEPIIGEVVKYLLNFLGVIFFILTLYGGFMWMTSRGNTDQVSKAKDIITTAIVGLIVVLFAYAITFFIIQAITTASGYNATND